MPFFKNKDIQILWITEINLKAISDCLKQQKKGLRKLHYSTLIVKYKDNIKKTWSMTKEAIGKAKIKQPNFQKKHCMGNKEIGKSL